MKKQIRYRLSVSRQFPKTHKRAGSPTGFVEKIKSALRDPAFDEDFDQKRHTIRANYELWQKRFEKIENGEAVLELYYWSGKPYNSKCETFAVLTKDDRIGVQKLQFSALGWFIDDYDSDFTRIDYAKNDGLPLEDFKEWFKKYNLSEPMAIIHFTNFRY
jgi:hypothetical protein